MPLYDTHCHLHDPEAFPDPDAEIEAALAAGVVGITVIGAHPADWDRALALAERRPEVVAACGWHPNLALDYDPASLTRLAEVLDHPRCVALGEIGLDFYWDRVPRDLQERALRDQLDLARHRDLPVVYHGRDAYSALLDVVEGFGPGRHVFHCFAGDAGEAARAVALGGYLGVDGPVTYPKAEGLREVLRGVPRERLLVETDAPYLAPAPFRGKPNRPAWVRYVAEGLARTLGETVEETIRLTGENAERVGLVAGISRLGD